MTDPNDPSQKTPAPAIDEARGKSLLLRFEGKRCIHSRQCVLGSPEVFRANVTGPWLHPDAIPEEDLAAIARSCPSGAITYERLDGGAAEAAPPVNVARIRENGPIAIHAEMIVEGRPMFRATFCRCGASRNKPFCDGAHVTADFIASGEPPTQDSEPLEARGGKLVVTQFQDGPIGVRGPLEICTGTGRTVLRTQRAALCRCGGSRNKPFCDGTHARIEFSTD